MLFAANLLDKCGENDIKHKERNEHKTCGGTDETQRPKGCNTATRISVREPAVCSNC